MMLRLASIIVALGIASPAMAQVVEPTRRADTVMVRLVDTDLAAAIQLLGRYLPKPVIAANIPSVRVSLETPHAVSPTGVAELLRGLVEAHGLAFIEDSTFYGVKPKLAEAQPTAVTASRQPIHFHVVRLKHARAADVAATLTQLLGGGGGFSGRAGLSAGTLSDEFRRQQVSASSVPVAPPAESPSSQSMLFGAVTIVPDDLTNSLLIRSTNEDFGVVDEAIRQLDMRPLQVLIEILIVEARSDKRFSLGADLFVPPKGPDGSVEARVSGGGLGDLVLRLLRVGRADLDATIRAAQSRGHLEIVSRPVLIASNNTEARLLVGTQRPFVQVSRSLPTDTPTRDQVIQYRDVGTKVLLRPTINQDGYVSLLIQQEVNAATSEVQFDAPIISTREASTQVLVKDGQTIMIGGLKDHQRERSGSGVPVLSSIPILGGLFGSVSRRSTATELYLFLTPRVLRTDGDADQVTEPRLPKEK